MITECFLALCVIESKDAMSKPRTHDELVLKIIQFLLKHRQSMGKVKLYFKVTGLLRKVYRGTAALLLTVAVD